MLKQQSKKLSGERRKALEALAKIADDKIDFSDLPEIRELPSDRIIGKFYRPRKTAVTIRLDSDVLAWLKASGDGYQTRINDYLRQRMRRNRKSAARS